MYIVIVGAGRIGQRLAELALNDGKENNNVIVIDKDQKRCEEVARKYDAIAINADATQEETLEESEVKKADVLVTTVRDDAVNLMVVSLARNKGVKSLVSLVNQEESIPMFMEKGVKIVKNPDLIIAENLYRAVKYPSIVDFMKVGEKASIFRIPLPPNSKISGKTIKEINLPKKSLIIAIERGDRFIIPTEGVELQAGDKVTVIAHKDQVDKVAKLLSQ
ncbi:MAG: TrkA family potassium uptake protein [Thermoplasmata archaeon]|nr:TrkA family potassium uptake protein [Thermoplasmata archaeon]RLF38692.1 MAG: potassium transporter [Thermoplasmata archaeon]